MSKRETDAARREAELEKQDDIALTNIVRAREHEPTIQVRLEDLLEPDDMSEEDIPGPICHSERSEES